MDVYDRVHAVIAEAHADDNTVGVDTIHVVFIFEANPKGLLAKCLL